jgi:malate synthase
MMTPVKMLNNSTSRTHSFIAEMFEGEEKMTSVARVNCAPRNFNPALELPKGFMEFLQPLHKVFTPRQRALVAERARSLAEAHTGRLPDYRAPSEAVSRTAGSDWRIDAPYWIRDQRNQISNQITGQISNQMTGPADDAELVVKMLNSGAPVVTLDLEDSMANHWPNLMRGVRNIAAALEGSLCYDDRKNNRKVAIEKSRAVILSRARGLHLNQTGVLPDEMISASLFDVALIAYQADPAMLKHPLAFYIPKSESAEEALWWRDLFREIERARGWAPGWIKCMALVESLPLAYQMEEFVYNLREHIVGLSLDIWDYLASLIHFNLPNPEWALPDRDTIPQDAQFLQRLRQSLSEICHRRGILAVSGAISGLAALYPDGSGLGDSELNPLALAVFEADERNEARWLPWLMDGVRAGHPDQVAIHAAQFPHPNRLRPSPRDIARDGGLTVAGTRAATRAVIRYRANYLRGRGASLLDGYLEDMATDRVYRLMIAQRMLHQRNLTITDEAGRPVRHTPEFVSALFNEELEKILCETTVDSLYEDHDSCWLARFLSEQMIRDGEFDAE